MKIKISFGLLNTIKAFSHNLDKATMLTLGFGDATKLIEASTEMIKADCYSFTPDLEKVTDEVNVRFIHELRQLHEEESGISNIRPIRIGDVMHIATDDGVYCVLVKTFSETVCFIDKQGKATQII